MNKQQLATFAKYMVCPSSINNSIIPLNELGNQEFNNYQYRFLSKNYKSDSIYTNKVLLNYIKNAILNITNKEKTSDILHNNLEPNLFISLKYNGKNMQLVYNSNLLEQDKNIKYEKLKSKIKRVVMKIIKKLI